MGTRRPTHEGTWYSSDAATLSASLDAWLSSARDAGVAPDAGLAAVIAPHAGYAFSGASAAHAYAAVDAAAYDTVFVLGPSHHADVRRRACVSAFRVLGTPLGGVCVDEGLCAVLREETAFVRMAARVDEDEHSIEMHLPYVRKVFGEEVDVGGRVKVVPVMVGALDAGDEGRIGEVLGRWFGKPRVLFVISSDFCHWGRRFGYTFLDGPGEIWESIERLDRRGMDQVEEGGRQGFADYLAETENTVCGRFPIGVMLAAVEACGRERFVTRFVHYEQSSKCRRKSDSSVSYASAHVRLVAAPS